MASPQLSSIAPDPLCDSAGRLRALFLDQFDLVAVRILDERDLDAAELHRARLAHDLDALVLERRASLVDVVAADREMAERGTLIVFRRAPVVGQLDDRAIRDFTVADEGQRELAVGVVALAEQLHTERVAVKLERLVEVVD